MIPAGLLAVCRTLSYSVVLALLKPFARPQQRIMRLCVRKRSAISRARDGGVCSRSADPSRRLWRLNTLSACQRWR